jgi:hypothetical protein
MDIKDLVTVYTVANPAEAEIIKNYLQSEGIHCFLEGVNQAAYPGLISFEITLQVAAADADRARKLVAAREARRTG